MARSLGLTSRMFPTCAYFVPISGKPEIGARRPVAAAGAIGVVKPRLAREEVVAGKSFAREQPVLGRALARDLAGGEDMADGDAALGERACEHQAVAIERVALRAHQRDAMARAFGDDAIKPFAAVFGGRRALVRAGAQFLAAIKICDR